MIKKKIVYIIKKKFYKAIHSYLVDKELFSRKDIEKYMKNNTKFANLMENKNEIIDYIDSMTKTIEEKKTQIPLPKDITVFRREIYESKILDLYKKMPLNKQKDLQILIEKLHELDDNTIDSLLRDLISEDEIIIKKTKNNTG